jgi:hypothetical protein
MGQGYDYDAPDSVHKLPYDALTDFEPNFWLQLPEPRLALDEGSSVETAEITCSMHQCAGLLSDPSGQWRPEKLAMLGGFLYKMTSIPPSGREPQRVN